MYFFYITILLAILGKSQQDSSSCLPHANVQDLEYLDIQMDSALRQLPAAIEAAKADIEQGTADGNRDKLIVGIACLMGAVSGSLGVIYGKDPFALSAGDQIALAAQNAWGYGYWGPFLLDIDDADAGCGLKEFNQVVFEYSFVTNLQAVYGNSAVSFSGLADDRPELRKYYVGEFGRKLKLALHCITSQASSSSSAARVVSLIDKYVKMASQRLDITAQLMSV